MKKLSVLMMMLLGVAGIYAIYSLFPYITIIFGNSIMKMVIKMIGKGVKLAIPYICIPVALYTMCNIATENIITRILMGTGCVCLLWYISPEISFSMAGAKNCVKLIFQMYFLMTLLLPQELVSIIGGIVTTIGVVIIYIFPGLSDSVTISLICSMVFLIFVYINTLASIVKRAVNAIIRKTKGLSAEKFMEAFPRQSGLK